VSLRLCCLYFDFPFWSLEPPRSNQKQTCFFDSSLFMVLMGWLPMPIKHGVAVWLPLALSQVPSMYRTRGSRMAPYMTEERNYRSKQRERQNAEPCVLRA
jgi:hypothetical protein